MNALARKLLFFGLQFVPLFVVFVFLYLAVYPHYASLTVGAANAVSGRMSPPTHVEARADGDWQAFVFTPRHGMRPLRSWGPSTGHLILLGLALLPGLLLATPGPLKERLRSVAIALPVLFAMNVLSIVGLTRGVHCLQEAPGAFHCLWLLRLVYSSGQLLAAVLWVLLTWRRWLAPPA
jgi:hypothetical protein